MGSMPCTHLHDKDIESHDLARCRVAQSNAVESKDFGEDGRELRQERSSVTIAKGTGSTYTMEEGLGHVLEVGGSEAKESIHFES